MLSIIICSRDPQLYARLETNIKRTVGVPYEMVRVSNEQNERGICAAYNYGMDQARGDIFLFLHEDVLFVTTDWGKHVLELFADSSVGGVGIAGSDILPKSNCWLHACAPHLAGRVLHPVDETTDADIRYALNDDIAEVVCLDGVFIAGRASLARKLRFDEVAFPKFDYYDMDFSLRLAQVSKVLVTPRLRLKHYSNRLFSETYFFNEAFQQKHGAILPYSKKPIPADYAEGKGVTLYKRVMPKVKIEEE